nr:ARMT1-like domain-containing protein [uncultured Sphaerochaeta sp.]
MADKAGGIVFDLAVIHFLLRLGHTVILSVKNAAFFDYVYLGDMVSDPSIAKLTNGAEIISNPRLTQNQLAASLRNDPPLKIITDGTMERLNLMRTSVTFGRAFKEVDGVIAKGPEQRRRFMSGKFEFTQDIYCVTRGDGDGLNVTYKARCPRAPRFSSTALKAKAEEIIAQMRQAKRDGMTVMFYSGIVGSIPGETDTAIEVMTTFIDDLQQQQAETFIINPSSYFEPGMDADDLMYMWEIVQRSGLIDIWRFQTYQDVEKSFALMGRKVPPQWVGKDATFSTGSTKERAIAADVQKRNQEMQIIGPDLEKFLRRGEYGIGMFHDTRLNQLYEP